MRRKFWSEQQQKQFQFSLLFTRVSTAKPMMQMSALKIFFSLSLSLSPPHPIPSHLRKQANEECMCSNSGQLFLLLTLHSSKSRTNIHTFFSFCSFLNAIKLLLLRKTPFASFLPPSSNSIYVSAPPLRIRVQLHRSTLTFPSLLKSFHSRRIASSAVFFPSNSLSFAC